MNAQNAKPPRFVWRDGMPHQSLIPEYWICLAWNERRLAEDVRTSRFGTIESMKAHLREAELCEARARKLIAAAAQAHITAYRQAIADTRNHSRVEEWHAALDAVESRVAELLKDGGKRKSKITWLIERGSPASYVKRFDGCDDIIVWTTNILEAKQFKSSPEASAFAERAAHTAINFELSDIRICDHIGLTPHADMLQPAAWLHNVVQNDGEGDQDDLALSFSPDNFPLEGDAPYLWRSTGCRPLYLLSDDSNVAHETGLTPRQLAEQRAELLEALQGLERVADQVREYLRASDEAPWAAELADSQRIARAAIAKAGGAA